MAGTSIGMGTIMLVGMRVSVPPTFIPGYTKPDGKEINPCLKVRAYVNRKNGRSDIYDVRMWGNLAITGAKSLSVGKEFHARLRPESYEGRVWKDKGATLLTNSDGTDVKVLKHSFVVEDIVFGAESNKHITEEIAAGKRPANWNDGGEGSKAYKAVLIARKEFKYDGTSKTFGYAKVQKNGTSHAPEAPLQNQVATAANNPALQQAFGNAAAMADDNPF